MNPPTTPTTSARPATDPGDPGFIGATSHDVSPSGPNKRRRTPLGWLPWAALVALLALLLLVALAGTFVGRRDSTGTRSPSASSATSTSAGSLTARGHDLLAGGGAPDRIRGDAGAAVVGHRVLVQSVVADEGFWVGRSTSDRVFVYLTPQARRSNGESPFQVRAGQRVDLTGTVGTLGPNGAQRLGVTDDEGARRLTAQKAYVVATTVHLSS